jgi:hypothetical protein
MKKALGTLFVLALSITTLTACGGEEETTNPENVGVNIQVNTEESPEGTVGVGIEVNKAPEETAETVGVGIEVTNGEE